MTKTEAIALFGTTMRELGAAVGLTRARISQWPEALTTKQADLVRGAAMRLGVWPGMVHSQKTEMAAEDREDCAA